MRDVSLSKNNKWVMDNKQRLKRMIKECFWDYCISPEKIQCIVTGKDFRLKKKLFRKIIQSSSDCAGDLTLLFFRDDLEQLLNEAHFPEFYGYMEKRLIVLQNILLNKKIKERHLEWKKM